MGQPTVAELDRQAFQALRKLHLKVFPPNQRNSGIFLDEDLRLKTLMKDVDCSDLAVREAWESFVSTIVLSRSNQSRREGTPAARREQPHRRMRPYQTGDLLRIFEAADYPSSSSRRYRGRERDAERTVYAPPDEDEGGLEILPLESPDSPWRTGWNWVRTRTRSPTPEDEPPRALALASPRARSASPESASASASASGAWLAEWTGASAHSSAQAVPTLRRRHRFHAHRPRNEAQRSRTFDELHGHYRRDLLEARRARETATEGSRGRDTRRDGVVFPDSFMNAVESWEADDDEADFWAGASMARSRPPRAERSEGRGRREEAGDSAPPESSARETTDAAEGVGRSERLVPHVELPRYGINGGTGTGERRIAPLPRRARDPPQPREW